MPAAAVIPAPIAYIKVVAVKKLVVEPWARCIRSAARPHWVAKPLSGDSSPRRRGNPCYCEEIRVFKAGYRLNTSAWNNKIRHKSSCWFGGMCND